MTKLAGLSDAHLVLLAVQLCSNGDLSALPYLRAQSHGSLNVDIFLRIILTFLPESTEPSHYTTVLDELTRDSISQLDSDVHVDISSVKELSDSAARNEVRKLRLLPLQLPGRRDDDAESPFVQFLIHRAHRIDTESGLQPFILELLQPFVHLSPSLRLFLVSTLLPLLRFNYEYQPERGAALSLEIIQCLDPTSAVNILLSKAERRELGGDVGRDLKGLVSPWMYGHAKPKRRKLDIPSGPDAQSSGEVYTQTEETKSEWEAVNEWLLSTSIRDFSLAVEAIEGWSGPEDADLGGYASPEDVAGLGNRSELLSRYGQSALATIYATSEAGHETLKGSCQILSKIAPLINDQHHPTLHIHHEKGNPPSLDLDLAPFSKISRASLLQNNLLDPSNTLTSPGNQSIAFLDALLVSMRMLNGLDHAISCRAIADLCLLGNEEMQLAEVCRILHGLRQKGTSDQDWRDIRRQLLWLRNWGRKEVEGVDNTRPPFGLGLFWRIPLSSLETELLQSLLAVREYVLARDVYCNKSGRSPLSAEQVEAAVTESIFEAYDNASNGNKTRGGMKRATEMLEAFVPHFQQSQSFRQIKALISATHALSFYALTLQHGVPFQPVSIRVHKDPLSLIEKVLEQNSKAYTQLDNLLAIGRDLVAAGFHAFPTQEDTLREQSGKAPIDTVVTAERRITSLAISSALESSDFDTAYSYVLTRLTPPSLLSNPSQATNGSVQDNISWRAAFNAGRHRPSTEANSSRPLHSQIRRLEQRMELLSLALMLAPSPEYLPEILAVWRRCDEEMSNLRAQESEEAEKWDARGDNAADSTVPGGFGPSDSELDALETQRQRERRLRARNAGLGGYEEAPMGLFDVARGAARAISKNAFPLSAASASASAPTAVSEGASGPPDRYGAMSESTSDAGDPGRVRKRDMVSNMVTGGLASGIGWVLGAQPVNTNPNP